MDTLRLSLVFFLSGFTSLVFQTLWIRVLSLGVGSTSMAMGLVLGIFFGGLALGSWWTGNYSKPIRNPLLLYGFVEFAIGIYALALLPILFSFPQIIALFPISSLSVEGSFLKFSIVGLFLLLPTMGMGASLPILIRSFSRPLPHGKKVSLLYGINTLGAATGALFTGFFLIPNIGIDRTNQLAACVTFFILVLSFLFQKQSAALKEQEGKPVPESSSSRPDSRQTTSIFSFLPKGELEKKRLLFLPLFLFCTGFSSLSFEVVWNKYLGIFLGSNIYGLSLILFLFLLGIGLGSLFYHSILTRIEKSYSFFTLVFFVTNISFFATTASLNLLPTFQESLSPLLSFLSIFSQKVILASIVLFLPGFCLGILFPLAISLSMETNWSKQTVSPSDATNSNSILEEGKPDTTDQESAKQTGRLYAINTIGSICGSILTGIIFIPWLGSGVSLGIATFLLLVCGFFFSWKIHPLSSVYAILIVALPFLPSLTFEKILRSAYPNQKPKLQGPLTSSPLISKDSNAQAEIEEFLSILEGKTGIISLSHDPNDGSNYKKYLRLKTNGLNESIFDLENLDVLPKYEALLGFLPFAFSKDPQSAFVVGYGGGFTVDLLTGLGLKNVLVAEIEEKILKAADLAHKNQNPVLQRSNLQLQIEDARFLLSTGKLQKFDLIVSQPSHSWLPGAANLFTKEFFEIVSKNISPIGIYSQWLNLYNMNPDVLKSILFTFYSVFPYGFVFTSPGDQELIMIGSMSPISLSMKKLSDLAKDPKLRRQLSHLPFRSEFDLLAQYAMSRSEILKLTEGSLKNTDRNAFAEVTQSKLFYATEPQFPAAFLWENFQGEFSTILSNEESSNGEQIEVKYPSPEFHRKLLTAIREKNPSIWKTYPSQEFLLNKASPRERLQILLEVERYASLEKSFQDQKNLDKPVFEMGLEIYLRLGKREKALDLWKSYPRLQSRDSCFFFDLTETSFSVDEKKIEAWIAKKDQCGPFYLKTLGARLVQDGHWLEAKPYLEEYYEKQPFDLENYDRLILAYRELKEEENEKNFSAARESMVQQEAKRLKDLAKFYRKKELEDDAKALMLRAEKILGTKFPETTEASSPF